MRVLFCSVLLCSAYKRPCLPSLIPNSKSPDILPSSFLVVFLRLHSAPLMACIGGNSGGDGSGDGGYPGDDFNGFCNNCGRVFLNGRAVANHQKAIHKNCNSICPECSRRFRNKAAVDQHVYNRHDSGKKKKETEEEDHGKEETKKDKKKKKEEK
ncbi:hypothetical protein CDL15_Pgr027493 [Punica granatum]|uniref:C2H2-type domain-containing protein n=2 Tax=Punica granatum TaxID=22663 RepID=A0A218XJ11_PUNGR|nr:hypothetical protein CDL15_Pgr027493 [Punica granatum]